MYTFLRPNEIWVRLKALVPIYIIGHFSLGAGSKYYPPMMPNVIFFALYSNLVDLCVFFLTICIILVKYKGDGFKLDLKGYIMNFTRIILILGLFVSLHTIEAMDSTTQSPHFVDEREVLMSSLQTKKIEESAVQAILGNVSAYVQKKVKTAKNVVINSPYALRVALKGLDLWSDLAAFKSQDWDTVLADEYKSIDPVVLPSYEDAEQWLAFLAGLLHSCPDISFSLLTESYLPRCNRNITYAVTRSYEGATDLAQKVYHHQLLFWFKELVQCGGSDEIYKSLVQKGAWEALSEHFNSSKRTTAKVRSGMIGSISPQEKSWLKMRCKGSKGDPQEGGKPLKIGIALSGGGYRAMTFAAGFLTGLEKIGILKEALYVSGLSGSSWFIAPWLASGKDIEKQKNQLKNRMQNANILSLLEKLSKEEKRNILYQVVLPKALCGKKIASTDIFGALLSKALLGENGQSVTMRTIAQKIISAKDKPFPICTAVSPVTTDKGIEYHWYEFNPFECENTTISQAIPIEALGYKFFEGTSYEVRPHQESLGSLMGFWGSAYAINLSGGIDAHHLGLVQPVTWLAGNLLPTLRGKKRFYPAEYHAIPGVANHVPNGHDEKLVTFVDAGIDFNLPIIPLLKKERELDVIIVGDASDNITKKTVLSDGTVCSFELAKFFDKVREWWGIEYRQEGPKHGEGCYIYVPVKTPQRNDAECIQGKKLPVIIYLNFEYDKEFVEDKLEKWEPREKDQIFEKNNLATFNATSCLKGYGSTFNFNYTTEQFAQLAGIAELNVRVRKNEIMKILKMIANDEVAPLIPDTDTRNVEYTPDVIENYLPHEDREGGVDNSNV